MRVVTLCLMVACATEGEPRPLEPINVQCTSPSGGWGEWTMEYRGDVGGAQAVRATVYSPRMGTYWAGEPTEPGKMLWTPGPPCDEPYSVAVVVYDSEVAP